MSVYCFKKILQKPKFLSLLVLISLSSTTQAQSPTTALRMDSGILNGTVDAQSGRYYHSFEAPDLPTMTGIQPNFSLTYSQSFAALNEGLGAGWSISQSSFSYDMIAGRPEAAENWDAFIRNNAFLLDGMILILLEDSGDRLSFVPQASDRDIKITWQSSNLTVGRGSDSLVYEEGGFVVYEPNGVQKYYPIELSQNEADGTQHILIKAPLRHELYPTGQRVDYSYRKHDGLLYFDEITFAGGRSRYKFHLVDKSWQTSSFLGGYPQYSSKLYSEIDFEFKKESEWITKETWCFIYQSSSPISDSPDCQAAGYQSTVDQDTLMIEEQLVSIERFGNADLGEVKATNLPKTVFTYAGIKESELTSLPANAEVSPMVVNPGLQIDEASYKFADVNFDGVVDAIAVNTSPDQVYLGQANSSSPYSSSSIPFYTIDSDRSSLVAPDLSSEANQFADIDGDSMVDLITVASSGNMFQTFFAEKTPSTLDRVQSHFIGSSATLVEMSFVGYWYQGQRSSFPESYPRQIKADDFIEDRTQWVDLNGDGKDDLVRIIDFSLNNESKLVWEVFYNTTTVSGEFGDLKRQPSFSEPHIYDLATNVTSYARIALDSNKSRLIDINADGLVDFVNLIVLDNREGICVYPNTGSKNSRYIFGVNPDEGVEPTSFHCNNRGYFTEIEGLNTITTLAGVWFANLNGDQYPELVTKYDGGQTLTLQRRKGNFTFVTPAEASHLALGIELSPGDQDEGSRLIDIDADGFEELMIYDRNNSGRLNVIDFNRNMDRVNRLPQAILVKAEDSLGNRIELNYSRLIDETIRDFSIDMLAHTNQHHQPMILVKQMRYFQPDFEGDNSGPRTTEYIYHNPNFDPIDRRFLGFAKSENLQLADWLPTMDSSSFVAGKATVEIVKITYDMPRNKFDYKKRFHAGEPMVTEVYSLSSEQCSDAVCQTFIQRAQNLETNIGSPDVFVSQHTQEQINFLPSFFRDLTQLSFTNQQRSAVNRCQNCSGSDYFYIQPKMTTQATFDIEKKPTVVSTALNYSEGENYNLPRSITINRSKPGARTPGNLAIANDRFIQEFDYSRSRQTLSQLGIVTLPAQVTSKRQIGSTTTIVGKTDYFYHSEKAEGNSEIQTINGLVKREIRSIYKDQESEPYQENAIFYQHDEFGNIIAIDDSLGPIERMEFDQGIFLTKRSQVRGVTKDQNSTRELLITETMRFDDKGRLKTIINPLGYEQSFDYDSLNRVVSIADSEGSKTSFAHFYGSKSKPTMMLTSLLLAKAEVDEKLQFFGSEGQLLATATETASGTHARIQGLQDRDRNGFVLTQWGNRLQPLPGPGIASYITQTHWDIPERDPASMPYLNIAYDQWGRPHQQLDSKETLTTTEYRNWGTSQILSYKEPESSTTSSETEYSSYKYFVEGLLGRLAVIESNTALSPGAASAHSTIFDYDTYGQLASITLPTDPADTRPIIDRIRKINHDSAGRMLSQTIPGVADYEYLYDIRSRKTKEMITSRDGKEQILKFFTYDNLDRATSLHIKDVNQSEPSLAKQWFYDTYPQANELSCDGKVLDFPNVTQIIAQPLGLMTTAISCDPIARQASSMALHFQNVMYYDHQGRLKVHQSRFSDMPVETAKQEHFQHDIAGRLRSYTNAFDFEQFYDYTDDGRMRQHSYKVPGTNLVKNLVQATSFFRSGQASEYLLGSGFYRRMRYYDHTNELKDISTMSKDNQIIENLEMTWGGRGNLARVTDNLQGKAAADESLPIGNYRSRSASYAYNFKNELQDASVWGRQREYRYYNDGRIRSNGDFENGLEFRFSFFPEGDQAQSYRFDGFGRLIQTPRLASIRYDGLNRMIYTETLPEEGKASYKLWYGYDTANIRSYKRVVERNAGQSDKETLYRYWSESAHESEELNSKETDSAVYHSYLYTGSNRSGVYDHQNQQVFHFINDQVGTTQLMLDDQGEIVRQFRVDPYGRQNQ